MKTEFHFKVRGYELDSFNHVNNAVYLNYLEEARWDFFNHNMWLGYLVENNLFPVVIETCIKYVEELRAFDEATIKSKWGYSGNYLIAYQDIHKQVTGKRACKAKVKMLLVSKDRVIYDLPQFIKDKLEAV